MYGTHGTFGGSSLVGTDRVGGGVSRKKSSSLGLQGSHDLTDMLEVLQFGLLGCGVTNLVGSVLPTYIVTHP